MGLRPAEWSTFAAVWHEGFRLCTSAWMGNRSRPRRRIQPVPSRSQTLAVTNDLHGFEGTRSSCAASASIRSVRAWVSTKNKPPRPRSRPACNLGAGTTAGALPALAVNPVARVVPLSSGGFVEVFESFRVPWRPQISHSGQGVHLLLDVARSRSLPESDGLVGSDLALDDLAGGRTLQVTIRNWGVDT